MLFSLGGSYLMLLNRQFDYQKLTVQEQIPVALFSVLFCANIVVGNAALRYVAVSLVQVVRSIIPGLTLILSMVVLGKSFESIYYGVVTLIVVGVALASYGEVEFHVFGFLLTLLVCFLSSLKSVTSQRFLVGKLKFHPFDLLLRMSWMAAVQMALLSLVFEREGILTWWAQRHAAPTDDDDGTSLASGNGMLFFALSLTLNGSLAFFLNYTNFMTTKKTSALTVTVAGNVKHMATIIVSVMLFRNPSMRACVRVGE
jgi:drug/metabolite transporter (DMT)-like permease